MLASLVQRDMLLPVICWLYNHKMHFRNGGNILQIIIQNLERL